MSIASFLKLPDVHNRLKPLRPRSRRRFDVPVVVPPRSKRHTIVGTAFDYLVRFELQRLAPHAVCSGWVAEHALDRLSMNIHPGGVSFIQDFLAQADPSLYVPPEIVAERARHIVLEAKSAVAAYIADKSPNNGRRRELAAHAIRLANLDIVVRTMQLDPAFDAAADDDVQDLLDMMKLVPIDKLLHPEILLLNPCFNDASLAIGGDADLITGDTLVDFKTTNKDEIDAGHLDRLLVYFLLARKTRVGDPSFPAINRVALYYARRRYLFSFDTSVWLEHPEFADTEAWFFQRAAQVFQPSRIGAANP